MKDKTWNLINRVWFMIVCLTSVYFAFTESENFRRFFAIMGIVPMVQFILLLFRNPK